MLTNYCPVAKLLIAAWNKKWNFIRLLPQAACQYELHMKFHDPEPGVASLGDSSIEQVPEKAQQWLSGMHVTSDTKIQSIHDPSEAWS